MIKSQEYILSSSNSRFPRARPGRSRRAEVRAKLDAETQEKREIAFRSAMGHALFGDLPTQGYVLGRNLELLLDDLKDGKRTRPVAFYEQIMDSSRRLYQAKMDLLSGDISKKTAVLKKVPKIFKEHLEALRQLGQFLEKEDLMLFLKPGVKKTKALQRYRLVKESLGSAEDILEAQIEFVEGDLIFKNTDIGKFLQSVAASPILSKQGYKVKIDKIQRDLPRLAIQRHLLRRLIGELAKNTYEAGEKVGISNPVLKISASFDASNLILKLEDNAGGIPPDLLADGKLPGRPKIFDLEISSKGGGVGLAEAWHIVKLHKGTIRVVSKAGKGTAFEIQIPRPRSEVRSASARDIRETLTFDKGIDAANQKRISELLSKESDESSFLYASRGASMQLNMTVYGWWDFFKPRFEIVGNTVVFRLDNPKSQEKTEKNLAELAQALPRLFRNVGKIASLEEVQVYQEQKERKLEIPEPAVLAAKPIDASFPPRALDPSKDFIYFLFGHHEDERDFEERIPSLEAAMKDAKEGGIQKFILWDELGTAQSAALFPFLISLLERPDLQQTPEEFHLTPEEMQTLVQLAARSHQMQWKELVAFFKSDESTPLFEALAKFLNASVESTVEEERISRFALGAKRYAEEHGMLFKIERTTPEILRQVFLNGKLFDVSLAAAENGYFDLAMQAMTERRDPMKQWMKLRALETRKQIKEFRDAYPDHAILFLKGGNHKFERLQIWQEGYRLLAFLQTGQRAFSPINELFQRDVSPQADPVEEEIVTAHALLFYSLQPKILEIVKDTETAVLITRRILNGQDFETGTPLADRISVDEVRQIVSLMGEGLGQGLKPEEVIINWIKEHRATVRFPKGLVKGLKESFVRLDPPISSPIERAEVRQRQERVDRRQEIGSEALFPNHYLLTPTQRAEVRAAGEKGPLFDRKEINVRDEAFLKDLKTALETITAKDLGPAIRFFRRVARMAKGGEVPQDLAEKIVDIIDESEVEKRLAYKSSRFNEAFDLLLHRLRSLPKETPLTQSTEKIMLSPAAGKKGEATTVNLEMNPNLWLGKPWDRPAVELENSVYVHARLRDFLRTPEVLRTVLNEMKVRAVPSSIGMTLLSFRDAGHNRRVAQLTVSLTARGKEIKKDFALKMIQVGQAFDMNEASVKKELAISERFKNESLFKQHFGRNYLYKKYEPKEKGDRSEWPVIIFQLDRWVEGKELDFKLRAVGPEEGKKLLRHVIETILKTWDGLDGLTFDTHPDDIVITPENVVVFIDAASGTGLTPKNQYRRVLEAILRLLEGAGFSLDSFTLQEWKEMSWVVRDPQKNERLFRLVRKNYPRAEVRAGQPYFVELEKLDVGGMEWKAKSDRGTFVYQLKPATHVNMVTPQMEELIREIYSFEAVAKSALDMLTTHVSDYDISLLINKETGELAGMYNYIPDAKVLHEIVVHPKFRGTGAVDILLEDLKQTLRVRKPSSFRVNVIRLETSGLSSPPMKMFHRLRDATQNDEEFAENVIEGLKGILNIKSRLTFRAGVQKEEKKNWEKEIQEILAKGGDLREARRLYTNHRSELTNDQRERLKNAIQQARGGQNRSEARLASTPQSFSSRDLFQLMERVQTKETLMMSGEDLTRLTKPQQEELFKTLFMNRSLVRLVVYNDEGKIEASSILDSLFKLDNVFRTNTNAELAYQRFALPKSLNIHLSKVGRKLDPRREFIPETRTHLKFFRLKDEIGIIVSTLLYAQRGYQTGDGFTEQNGFVIPTRALLAALEQQYLSQLVFAVAA